jgi:peptidoglycan/LPS O-acetylase OafA/YrhL
MHQYLRQDSAPKNNKLLGLEIIRFIAAMSVLFWHYQHFFYVADKPTDFVSEQQPLYSTFSFFYTYGHMGVQVFWCISGFIFFSKYSRTISEKIIDHKKFFVLRFSRLYPLHFATLLLVAVLQIIYFSRNNFYFVYQNNDFRHLILQLFFASNWGFQRGDSFNGPIWSISVEVVIYMIFYLVLRYVGKSWLVNIAVLLLCAASRVAHGPSPIVDCLGFFYIGGLSAIALQYFEKTKYHNLLSALSLAAVFLVPVTAYVTRIYHYKSFAFLFLMTYVPTLLYIAARNVTVHPTVQSVVEAAGNMTYSSYLIHFPIQLTIAIFFAYTNQAIPAHSLTFFLGFMFVTLVASYYIFRFFEKPAQGFIRHKFRRLSTKSAQVQL